MNKALFLDRDGVINHDKEDDSFTYELSEFIILPDVINTLVEAVDRGYLLFIITNQSGVGRGIYSLQHVKAIHEKLASALKAKNITFTEIFSCVHHPSTSECICRKPNSLLFEKAIAKYNIDVNKSIMVGDRQRDIDAALKAGITKTLLIQSNSSLKQVLPLLVKI